MFPRQLEANGRQWSHPGEDSRTRWLTNTGSQRTTATTYTSLYDLYYYNPITSANNTSSTSPCSLLLQHLLCPIATAAITLLWSRLKQQLLRLYDLYCYSTYYVTKTPILQQLICPYELHWYTTYYVLWSILLQQLLYPYDLQCHSTYYVTKTSILQQIFCPYDLHWYTNYHAPMIHIVTTTIRSIWSILLQHILRH